MFLIAEFLSSQVSLRRQAFMDDKIIVRIMGGLGNQMFRYAWGRFLVDRLNVPLELDLTTFDEGYEARSFALDYFNITTKLASREDVALLRKRPF